jgi:replicative DNA helicase
MFANIDIERDILLSIILFPDEYSIFIKSLETNDFTLEYHKKIFTALKTLFNEGKKIDVILLSEQIPDIAKFIDNSPVPAAAHIKDYINELKRLKVKRDLEKLSMNVISSLKKGVKVEKVLAGITKYTRNFDIQTDAVHIKDLALKVMKDMEEEQKKIKKRAVLSLRPIENILRNGEMTVIGARPGTGKTAFALKMAYDLAKEDKTVYFVSREMTGEQITKRLLSKVSRVDFSKFVNATLEEDDWREVANALTEIAKLNILIDDKTSYIEDIYLKIASKKVDYLIIDYLQLMQTHERAQTRDREIGIITRTLKVMNLDLNIPIVVLSQLNREGAKEPTLATLRESGNIEQDFDNVIFLHDKNKDKEEEETEETNFRKLKLIIAKQRNGKTGKYDIYFEPSLMEFYDVWKGEPIGHQKEGKTV